MKHVKIVPYVHLNGRKTAAMVATYTTVGVYGRYPAGFCCPSHPTKVGASIVQPNVQTQVLLLAR